MIETKILDETLALINDDGTEEAYNYLLSNLNMLEDKSSQVYNFLYCLAATSNKPEEAVKWLEEAILIKELWYRPDVFEDEDLDSIRCDERFIKCKELSQKRFMNAMEKAESIYTWNGIKANNLITVLHGNQQNNKVSEYYWSELGLIDYQIEYLQSKELDSYQLYRWEDNGDGPAQLEKAIKSIDMKNYKTTVLGGFSAGCNTILRSLKENNVTCSKIILQSPWMPIIENDPKQIIELLMKKNIEVLIICGKEDEDCFPQCLIFESAAKELGFNYKKIYIDGIGHEYPEDFKAIVQSFLV